MNRLRLIIILVVVLVLGCLTIVIFRVQEPRYQGRTLSKWIEGAGEGLRNSSAQSNVDPLHPETDPTWQAASQAVKQMAPKAIPVLLRWAQAKDSPLKEKIIEWVDNHSSFHLQPETALDRSLLAVKGFSLLGSEAKPAWPVLIDWACSTNRRHSLQAFLCLEVSKPDKETLMPALLRLIHSPDNWVQYYAAAELHRQFPKNAETAGVYKMFPELKNAPTNQFNINQSPVK